MRPSREFSGNEQMQMVFTTEEFLELAMESWSDLKPTATEFRSIRTPTELSDLVIYYCYLVL